METINKTDAVKSKDVDAQLDTVNARLTTKRGDDTYQNHWTLDFSSCTREQVLELASRSVIITLQGQFRRADFDGAKAMENMDVDVSEELKRETGKAPTVANVAKRANRLDDNAKAQLIAELQAQLDNS